jgi:tRNA threonylcarbamoyladenosine biosynthesis protein TsaB
MTVLAIDSTARESAVAVLRDGKCLAEFWAGDALSTSEALLPMVERALSASALTLDDITLFAVAVGPGSFTGVRIGVSLIKGLAFGRGVPVAPVDTLEALAESLAPLPGLYAPVMDARRGEVYHALFRLAEDGGRLVRLADDRGIAAEALAEELLGAYPKTPVYLVGDGVSVAKPILTARGVPVADAPELLIRHSAGSVAKVACRMASEGRVTTAEALAPIYLRSAEVQVCQSAKTL